MPTTLKSTEAVAQPLCEPLAGYHKGGYHPVHIGDKIGPEGCFQVVHKLGWGVRSTTWLCFDSLDVELEYSNQQVSRWCAIKILRADCSGTCPVGRGGAAMGQEDLDKAAGEEEEEDLDRIPALRIGKLLWCDAGVEPRVCWDHHVCLPEEHYWLAGPNGTHLCVVMPFLGPSITDAARHFRDSDALKDVCEQVSHALAFLHAHGVVHGEPLPRHVLFTLQGLGRMRRAGMLSLLGRPRKRRTATAIDNTPSSFRSHRSPPIPAAAAAAAAPPKQNNSQPRYLVPRVCLPLDSPYVTGNVTLINFYKATRASSPDVGHGWAERLPFATPEAVLCRAGPVGVPSDLWLLGWTIAHVCTGRQVIVQEGPAERAAEWEAVMGPMPDPLRKEWAKMRGRTARVVNSARSLLAKTSAGQKFMSFPARALEMIERGRDGKGTGNFLFSRLLSPPPPTKGGEKGESTGPMSTDDLRELASLLELLFKWNPNERLPATRVLEHAFLANGTPRETGPSMLERGESDMA